jgi:hypothetical protein
MAKYETFSDYAKAHDLDDSTYPFARAGQRIFRAFMLSVAIGITLWIFGVLLSGASGMMPTSSYSPDHVSSLDLQGLGDFTQGDFSYIIDNFHALSEFAGGFEGSAWYYASAVSSYVAGVCFVLVVLVIFLLIFLAALYAFVVLLRWRSYERSCLSSDYQAWRLRRQLIRTLNINRRIRQLKQKAKKAESSTEIEHIDVSVESQLAALYALKKLRVSVNKRQALTGTEIHVRYSILIERPDIQSDIDELDKITKGLENTATRVQRGKVSFSTMIVSSDRGWVEFSDTLVEADKYHYVVEEIVEEILSQYTFPLSLFDDHQKSIYTAKKKASEWAGNTAKAMDNVIATISSKDQSGQSRRLRVDVGNTNALFTYEMALTINPNNFERTGATFDAIFKTSGTTITIEEGNLLITMPLPKDIKVPIDVPTMIREVFGKEDVKALDGGEYARERS